MIFSFERSKISKNKDRKTSENYWFKIVEKLSKERGKIPDPGEILAVFFIDGLGIPSGPYSAIELPITEESKRRDKLIAEYLTNKSGVLIENKEFIFGKKNRILSFDFRDIYPEGLPQELKDVLDERTLKYMNIELEHQKEVMVKYWYTRDIDKAECPIYYFRLPGGIDLFLRGYNHNSKWQRIHGEFLKEANKFAQIICIEGISNKPFGESLNLFWSNSIAQLGHYDVLMRDAVENGFKGLFTEIDARERVFFCFDKTIEKLPDDFFRAYFKYLSDYFPSLSDKVLNFKQLKNILIKLSLVKKGLEDRIKIIFYKGKAYSLFPYIEKDGTTSFEPTFLELGQTLFSDALAAIKLHLIAKLMTDGYLEKGPIVDYEGADHLSSKAFFLKYPQYAMEIVLRTIHHLVEGKIKEVPEVYKVFKNSDKEEIIRQITKLVFKKPEDDSYKSVKIGFNQRKLLDYPIDFLKIYKINPKNLIPSKSEIKDIRKKLFQRL